MIRKAEERDTEQLMQMLKEVLQLHHQGRPDIFKNNASKYTLEQLKQLLCDDSYLIFVHTDECDVADGYAFCIRKQILNDNIRTDIATLYIDDLCVQQNKRHQGIGHALFEYVRNYAKENGFYNLTLNVWYKNKEALAFYKKCKMKIQKMEMEIVL